jgi:signal transduction histidine kinase
MDLKRLRVFTIVGPIAFLVVLELLGIFVLGPTLGHSSVIRLLIFFLVLVAAVVLFSFWVFRTIERQQRDLARDAKDIEQLNRQMRERVDELRRAHKIAARHNRQLDAVNSAITSISSEIDLLSVLQNIADAARQLINSRYAALGVANEQGRIQQFITSGISAEQRAAIGPLPQGHGLLGTLIKEARPLRLANIGTDPRSHGFPPNHPPMTSLLGVPILFKGRAVGDLYLTDKIGASEFSEEDQDLLVLLANHAAVAIENARLYEEARTSRDRLQAWNERLESIVEERTREIERYSKELTTRVMGAQEEERKRIARELHDETAQSLSTLLITLDLLEQGLPAGDPTLRTGFDRVRGIAKRTLDEVRTLAHDLRPTILDDFGLEAALRWYAEEYRQTFGMPVETDIERVPGERLSPEIELALFRIAQEALTNSGRHGRPSRVRLALSFPDSSARLLVEDDGTGFVSDDVEGPTRHGGLGLYGMRERAELVGAHLEITSAPGRGTRVTASVPLADRKSESGAHMATACKGESRAE